MFQKSDEGYVIGTDYGRLSGRFSANMLDKCKGTHLELGDVPDDDPRPLREVARLQSGGSGQGLFKCHCVKSCTGRCKCHKAKRKCISRCHKGSHCSNK